MKNAIIDYRMRDCEKNFIKSLGYNLVELKESKKVYYEISSHVDIFVSKINENLVVEKSKYDYVNS